MRKIDFDIHGVVGIRLIDPSPADHRAVRRQLGPLEGRLQGEPDIVVRFVPKLSHGSLRYCTLGREAFDEESFFLLRSDKRACKARIPFEQIGGRCEILCESGARAVPQLLAIVNLTALRKDCVSLHASAFRFRGKGILVCGWAKGGKTESLLAFTRRGARYLGDEWILLAGDGSRMYGIPENLRLWEWHLDYLPHLRSAMDLSQKSLFSAILALERAHALLARGRLSRLFPLRFWGEALPALRRQLNIRLSPQQIFPGRFGPLSSSLDKVFFLLNHDQPHIRVSPVSPREVAARMVSSIRYEFVPFQQAYQSFKFAFPERANPFLERSALIQENILLRALEGKEAYQVMHPYPVCLDRLYEAMLPYCTTTAPRRRSVVQGSVSLAVEESHA